MAITFNTDQIDGLIGTSISDQAEELTALKGQLQALQEGK